MNKIKFKDWFIFGEWHGLYLFHACYFYGLVNTIKEQLGYGLSAAIIEQNKNIQTIYFSRSEWTNIGKRYLKEVIKNPKILQNLLKSIRLSANELVTFSHDISNIYPKNLSRQKQLSLLEKFHKKHHELWALGQVPNVLELENSLLTDYLKSWLAGKTNSAKEARDFFYILTAPAELSGAQKEERELLKLAVKKPSRAKIKNHWNKYSWINFGWTGPSLGLDYFIDVVNRFHREKATKSKLEKLLKNDRELIKQKDSLPRHLVMPNEIRNLFRLLEEIFFIKAYRMDALYISYEAIQPLLKAIAAANGISLSQLYSLEMEKMIPLLKNRNFDINEINKKAQYSVQLFDGKRIISLNDKESATIIGKIKMRLPKADSIIQIKGESAYPGKVRGVAKIINSAPEMVKFKRGEIIISNVTDPSLLPAMKKAKAFVTNMGGLTCHAAIVAREMHIPCVIGTKIATKIFKDGDLVEVDADRGVVRKL